MTYRLKDFGSYTVGGRIQRETEGEPYEVNFTRQARHVIDPRGHYAIEHAYVQYFIPEDRRPGPPVVLVHGGGMSGSCWETTPDGRPGWLHLLLRDGYEVHVMDAVERGRAGFAPNVWVGEPILRSMEEAWSLFRIGSPEGFSERTPFADQQFPVAHFETFARSFVPRWLGTTGLQTDALLAVLSRTGPALVFCHSQGAEITFDALDRAPAHFAGIVALEPSNVPNVNEMIRSLPFVLATGDHLNASLQWTERAAAWDKFSNAFRALGGHCTWCRSGREFEPGNSHMVMMDKNHEEVLSVCLEAVFSLSKAGSLQQKRALGSDTSRQATPHN